MERGGREEDGEGGREEDGEGGERRRMEREGGREEDGRAGGGGGKEKQSIKERREKGRKRTKEEDRTCQKEDQTREVEMLAFSLVPCRREGPLLPSYSTHTHTPPLKHYLPVLSLGVVTAASWSNDIIRLFRGVRARSLVILPPVTCSFSASSNMCRK